ncbi:serine/threonine-protein kinase [Streptomyces mashuensis]|uniref:serine/threonine-protein kinase n=1 Tax=Streptomyces mashuensis TaxID=33904 RepID=UPI00167E50F7|nr:serine/threonine-protein kinase [Streptomyces mashuensis]
MERLRPEDPRTLGAYRLLGRLGAGGMGRVYLARSGRGRIVAVKLIQPELAGQDEFRRRFRQEVRAARRVGGEWTAPVLDADTEAEIPWVATGYIAGPSLRQVVDRDHGALPERSVRVLGAGLARALQAVHAAGIVHRDLKPSNVLLTLDGPRVIDFGIARALDPVTDGGVTRTGQAVGSPGFMSPEQVRGEIVTPAGDVFCLGSVLAYAATGRSPFGTADSGAHAVMYRIAEEEPDLTGVPGGLLELISAALAKAPGDRPTPEEFLRLTGAADLTATLADPRSSAEPWLPAALVARLGRHAVALLEVESPEGPEGPESPAGDGEAPTRVVPPVDARPADPPTVTASGGHPLPPLAPPPGPGAGAGAGGAYGPYAPYGMPGGPVPPMPPVQPARPSRTPLLVAVLVTAALLAGGGTVYLLTRPRDNAGGHASASSGTAPVTAPPAGASPNSSATRRPTDDSTEPDPVLSLSPAASPTAGNTGAQAYAGTWQAAFNSGSGLNNRTLTVRRGTVTQVTIQGSGVLDDGTPYSCQWTATATGGGTAGTPLHLGPSTVTQASPRSACQPGSASDLVLLPDGRMRRDFTDSGTRDASLVYSRTG